jgi:Ferritin-like domain
VKDVTNRLKNRADRRSFLKKGLTAGTATLGAGLLSSKLSAVQDPDGSGSLTKRDAAILRFLAATELIESDLWVQYNELGGIQDKERPELGGGGSIPYTEALKNLDGDMDQYIHDNTDDELSHAEFLNAYLASKGADTVNLDRFRTLPSSKASGALQIGRLTNLMQLTVDTSWYTRYRDDEHNPDLDPNFVFPQAVPSLAEKGRQNAAIPRTDADLTPKDHIQAIANTAAFHFCFIEQGGTSIYPALALQVKNRDVLRILLSIGPTETAHFQTWHDKAGNAVSDPLAPLRDPKEPRLFFPNLNDPAGRKLFQTNLIMPEPCPFLSRKLPVCSIIRPVNIKAMDVVNAFIADGLFIGQSGEFFDFYRDLAADADSPTGEEREE